MELFRVLESGEGIEQTIRKTLSRRGGVGGRCVAESRPALLIVSPKAVRREYPLSMACRTALLPGEACLLPDGLRAAVTVRYGVSPGDNLTIFARRENMLWVALQRDLVTIDGHVVGRQEFPIRIDCGQRELSALAAAGALLLLGVPPEELAPTSQFEKKKNNS